MTTLLSLEGNFKLKLKEVKDDWGSLLYENDGSFTSEDQTMVFDYEGKEVVVSFDLSVSGFIQSYEGDHFSHEEITVNFDDITITSVAIDSDEIKITKEISDKLEKEVKKYL